MAVYYYYYYYLSSIIVDTFCNLCGLWLDQSRQTVGVNTQPWFYVSVFREILLGGKAFGVV